MQNSILALWLIAAVVCATSGATTRPVETASIQSKQVEVHSVVVDMPQVITLSGAFPNPGLLCRRFGRRTALRHLAKKRKLGTIAHRPPS